MTEETPEIPAEPIPESVPAGDTTTFSAEQVSPEMVATAPTAITALPVLIDEHKETLLQRIEDLPEEIVAWVKHQLAKH